MTSMMDSMMQDLCKSMQLKKDALIKEKLIECGYREYAENYKNMRFPRVACVIDGDWNYYYADNNTEKGEFIVAIKNYEIEPSFDGKQASHSMNVSFKWHCIPPKEDSFSRMNLCLKTEPSY